MTVSQMASQIRASQSLASKTLAGAAALLFLAGAANAADLTCTKDVPNPYKLDAGWAKVPRTLGSDSAIAVSPSGNVWAADRCGAGSCAASDLAPVMEFDADGKVIKSFGAGMFAQPHGLTIDKAGHLWLSDAQSATGKGQQVLELDQDGKVLMTLGKAGVSGKDADVFDQPTAVAFGRGGDIFVAEGHAPSNGNSRIDKFSKDGKLIKSWGKPGDGPDQMLGPHAIAANSKGRLIVADRNNARVLVFDQDGKLLATWTQFGHPQGVYIDAHDNLYISDTSSPPASGCRGIRVADAATGKVKAFIPDPSTADGGSGAEGVTADAHGNIYGSTVASKEILRWTK